MSTIHEFDFAIYPRLLWVTYNCPPEVLNDLFPEGDTRGEKFKKMGETDYACVDRVRRLKPDVKGGVLIRFSNKAAMKCDVIAHESVHAALEVFDYVDAKITNDNQEPFAYLVGFIAKCCDEVRKGKK